MRYAAVWLIAAVVFFASFFSLVSFLAAKSPPQAAKTGQPLPPGWSAGVMNHGHYYKWWLIRDNPVLFIASVVGFLAPWGLRRFFRKEK